MISMAASHYPQNAQLSERYSGLTGWYAQIWPRKGVPDHFRRQRVHRPGAFWALPVYTVFQTQPSLSEHLNSPRFLAVRLLVLCEDGHRLQTTARPTQRIQLFSLVELGMNASALISKNLPRSKKHWRGDCLLPKPLVWPVLASLAWNVIESKIKAQLIIPTYPSDGSLRSPRGTNTQDS